MSKRYYKMPTKTIKKAMKGLSLGIVLIGVGILAYVFFPLISWQIFFAPVFADQNINAPIPKTTVLTGDNLASLLSLPETLTVDYTNADNWFPKYKYDKQLVQTQTYNLSIPSLKIINAVVSVGDNDLSKHLVNFGGTAIPPNKGTAVIFGHSTLPWLFDTTNYKTIFATLHTIKNNDEILLNVDGVTYHYRVYEISVVNAGDVSIFDQNNTDSFLTLVTCTPPGTVWKRLLVKAKLSSI